MAKIRFTESAVKALEPTEKRAVYFDEVTPSLALRVQPTGRKTYYFCYRPEKGGASQVKWHMIGTTPPVTLAQAREKVKELAAQVFEGIDPAEQLRIEKNAPTMQEALERYEKEYFPRLKPMTLVGYRNMLRKIILPALGKKKVKDITKKDMVELHTSLSETPYRANRAINMLSGFFNWCERIDLRKQKSNPCEVVKLNKEEPRRVYLNENQMSLLGESLDYFEKGRKEIGESCKSIDAIRLLLFTGARKGEILSLRWENIDMEKGVAILPDSKTGYRTLQLLPQALEILNGIGPKESGWVFPSDGSQGHLTFINKAWYSIRKRAGLDGVRLHDLRHSFASMMINSGASLPVIGMILGHKRPTTTARYSHLEANPAREAATRAAEKIAAALSTPPQHANATQLRQAAGED